MHYCIAADPVFCTDCAFLCGERISLDNELYGAGFCLHVNETRHASSVSNSLFSKNAAYSGGAARIYLYTTDLLSYIMYCFFNRNIATNEGHDLYLQQFEYSTLLYSFTTNSEHKKLFSNKNADTYNWLPLGTLSFLLRDSNAQRPTTILTQREKETSLSPVQSHQGRLKWEDARA